MEINLARLKTDSVTNIFSAVPLFLSPACMHTARYTTCRRAVPTAKWFYGFHWRAVYPLSRHLPAIIGNSGYTWTPTYRFMSSQCWRRPTSDTRVLFAAQRLSNVSQTTLTIQCTAVSGIEVWKRECKWTYPRCAQCWEIYPTYGGINLFTPNDPNRGGRTAPLTSKRCISYIFSTNIGTEYFKRGVHSPLFSLQNAVCFIILTYLVPVLFTFYIQDVLKLKK